MFPSFSVAQRKEKRGNGKKKKNQFHPIFSKTLDHLEYSVIVILCSSLSGRMDECLQQPVTAGATACSGSETRSTAAGDSRQQQSSGLHLCPQQGRLEKSFTAETMPEPCSSALSSAFYAFHYLFRHWLGWEPKPVSRFLGGIFSPSWKRIFCKLAQTCLKKLHSLSKGVFFNTFRKGLQMAFWFSLAFTELCVSSDLVLL